MRDEKKQQEKRGSVGAMAVGVGRVPGGRFFLENIRSCEMSVLACGVGATSRKNYFGCGSCGETAVVS